MRGVRLFIFFFFALALCTVPFGESGCVFVDTEKTGQITFQAWCSECRIWTTEDDFEGCVREDVDVNSQSGSVILAMESIGTPVEPTAEVGIGYSSPWSEPGTTSYAAVWSAGEEDVVMPVNDLEDDELFDPATSDEIPEVEPPPLILSGKNATNVSVPAGDDETEESTAPEGLVLEGERKNLEGPVSVPFSEESLDVEPLSLSESMENASATAFLAESDEPEGQTGFKESSTGTDEDMSGCTPEEQSSLDISPLNSSEAGTSNGSVEDVPREDPTVQDFVGDELDPAPTAVAADIMDARGGVWTHRADVTITNPRDLMLEDYQVRVEVSPSNLPYGRSRYWTGVDDIRFTDSTGTLLPHWHDKHAGSNPAIFWVRVPSIPAEGTTIHLHYRNSDAASASDGDATFLFYDDFENTTDLWERWGTAGNIIVQEEDQDGNRVLKVRNDGYMIADHDGWSNIAVRERIHVGSSGEEGGVIARYDDTDNYLSAPMSRFWFFIYFTYIRIAGCSGGTPWSEDGEWDGSFSGGWRNEEFGLFEGRGDLYLDGSYQGSALLPAEAPSSGKTGFFVDDTEWQYRDEHIVRSYSPVYEGERYLSTGLLLSDVFDTEADGSKWDTFAWDASLPEGTEMVFAVRASNTSFSSEDGAPSWTAVEGPSPVSADLPEGRYLQWMAILSTDDDTVTPILQEVRVWYTPGGY